MKIGLSGGYFNHPIEEQIKKFQSMPEYLLYDGLTKRGHEVIPLPTSSFPFENVDILHCHHYSRILHYASTVKKTPVVFTPHNPFIFNPDYQLRWLDRIALKRIDALIVLSELEKQVYNERFGIADKTHVIPNGLKVDLYERPKRLISRLKWCIPDDRIVVLFVGQLLSYKGLEYLFRAIKGRLDLTLVIKSHHTTDIDKYRAIATRNTVFITSILSQKELTDLYHSCDIYCQPSLAEALPTVITEAMLCGKPVIATTVGGIPEQLPEKCGYLVDPKNVIQLRDGLKFLADDSSFRKYIGENAKRHALKVYNQDKMIEKHIKIYSELLSESC